MIGGVRVLHSRVHHATVNIKLIVAGREDPGCSNCGRWNVARGGQLRPFLSHGVVCQGEAGIMETVATRWCLVGTRGCPVPVLHHPAPAHHQVSHRPRDVTCSPISAIVVTDMIMVHILITANCQFCLMLCLSDSLNLPLIHDTLQLLMSVQRLGRKAGGCRECGTVKD